MGRILLLLAVGAAALAYVLHSVGLQPVLAAILKSGWALLPMGAIHLAQLFLSAQAWRTVLVTPKPSVWAMFRIRWVREGVNALLPVAQIGGQVAGVQLLVRSGMSAVRATAGIVLDLTLEATGQLVFTLLGIAVLYALRADRSWIPWIGSGLLLLAAGVAGFIAAQRAGVMRLAERGIEMLARQSKIFATWSLDGLHDELMRLQARHGALALALLLHTIGWSLGAAEVWVALLWLGQHVSMADAFVIEGAGMAARSAGFAVPGALGIQEGGFILIAGLFGISQTDALALSLLKRLREVLIGVPALWVYR